MVTGRLIGGAVGFVAGSLFAFQVSLFGKPLALGFRGMDFAALRAAGTDALVLSFVASLFVSVVVCLLGALIGNAVGELTS